MRSLLLKSSSATNTDNVYTFDVSKNKNSKLTAFRIKEVNVSYNPIVTTSVSDEDIASMNVAYFVNWSDESKILPTQIEDDEDVTSIVTQTGQSLTFSVQAGLQFHK